MKQIRADRVALALTNLADWKGRVHAQGATHLFPLLALLSAGAGLATDVVAFRIPTDASGIAPAPSALAQAVRGKRSLVIVGKTIGPCPHIAGEI